MTTAHNHWLPRPYLFRVGGWAVPSYTVMLYVGCLVGVEAGSLLADASGLDPTKVAVATIILLVPALVGSRLLYVAQHASVYRADPSRIWRRTEGGAALFGGLALALLVSVLVLPVMDLPFLGFWDCGAVTMAVGNVFTRVGCHLTGCCAGRATGGPIGIDLPNRAGVWARRVPAQLLESGWAALAVVAALMLRRRFEFDGAVFAVVVSLYGAGRAVLEHERERDGARAAPCINVAVAVALVATGAVVLIIAR